MRKCDSDIFLLISILTGASMRFMRESGVQCRRVSFSLEKAEFFNKIKQI